VFVTKRHGVRRQVGLVLLAKSPAQSGGDLPYCPEGDSDDYKQVFHTHFRSHAGVVASYDALVFHLVTVNRQRLYPRRAI